MIDLKKNMNSQILVKFSTFIKNRLLELFGIVLILISIFFLISLASYSPEDPNFIYTPENNQIQNLGGFYGSVFSDFLLQSIGLISFFVVLSLFYWGLELSTKKEVKKFIQKIFFTLVYIVTGTTSINVLYNDGKTKNKDVNMYNLNKYKKQKTGLKRNTPLRI